MRTWEGERREHAPADVRRERDGLKSMEAARELGWTIGRRPRPAPFLSMPV